MEGMIEAQIHWDTLYINLLLADPNFFLFADNLSVFFVKPIWSVSDQKEICAQSWGHIETFGDTVSPKTSSQQPCS